MSVRPGASLGTEDDMASHSLVVGKAVAYVVGGVEAFRGTLAYINGDWAGIRNGDRVDDVLVEFVRPV